MSYILDALKRADAERGQGAVPSLHVRQVTSLNARAIPPPSRYYVLVALGIVIAVGGAVGWWLARPPALAAPQIVPPATVFTVVPAPPQPPLPAVKPALALPPMPTPAASVAKGVSLPLPLPMLSDVPEDLRRQIPALTITGAVYSETPAQRLLLVNNLVLNQGSAVMPELMLEEVQPKSSIFSFRGVKFRVAH